MQPVLLFSIVLLAIIKENALNAIRDIMQVEEPVLFARSIVLSVLKLTDALHARINISSRINSVLLALRLITA